VFIKDKSTVLFQGDSITDYGRNYEDPDDLGPGYPSIIAGLFPVFHPEMDVRFINRGCGGNRVSDLETRWQKDCIDLQPDVVSILIGVNDTLKNFHEGKYMPPDQFEQSYRNILQRTVRETNAAIIIIEPLENRKFFGV
jgi:acyl-CoA thioesterase-1